MNLLALKKVPPLERPDPNVSANISHNIQSGNGGTIESSIQESAENSPGRTSSSKTIQITHHSFALNLFLISLGSLVLVLLINYVYKRVRRSEH